MEVVIFLRLLWRQRLRVAVGAVVAVALAVAVGGSPTPPSATATTRVLVDTPQSETVNNSSRGMDTLYWRATLLAMLLGTDSARHQIAGVTHVPANQIAVTDLELTAPANPASLPVAAIQAASTTTQPYVLTVYTDDVLPVVTVNTVAPTPAGAVRLAQGAIQTLGTGASSGDTLKLQGLNIRQISPIVAREISAGRGRVKMAMMAVVLFGMWCLVLIIVPAIRRGGRPAPGGKKRGRLVRPRRRFEGAR